MEEHSQNYSPNKGYQCSLPLDPNDPFYSNIPETVLPPLEAYLYRPPEMTQTSSQQKKTLVKRLIYEGWSNLNDFEEEKLKELYTELALHIKDDQIPPNFTERDFLKFLVGYNFKIPQVKDHIINHFNWRRDNLPCKLTSQAIKLINSGFIYVHGRDRKYRPILIIDASILQYLKEKFPGEFDLQEDVYRAAVFTCEYIKNYMFLPGQIEQWLIVTNLNHLAMKHLPAKEMQKLISAFSENYNGTLAQNIHINCTTVQLLFWRVIEVFVEKETKQKLHFFKESSPPILKKLIHPSQLEKRFGGEAETPTQFWPPIMPSQIFREDDIKIIGSILGQEEGKAMMNEDEYALALKENPKLVRRPDLQELRPDPLILPIKKNEQESERFNTEKQIKEDIIELKEINLNEEDLEDEEKDIFRFTQNISEELNNEDYLVNDENNEEEKSLPLKNTKRKIITSIQKIRKINIKQFISKINKMNVSFRSSKRKPSDLESKNEDINFKQQQQEEHDQDKNENMGQILEQEIDYDIIQKDNNRFINDNHISVNNANERQQQEKVEEEQLSQNYLQLENNQENQRKRETTNSKYTLSSYDRRGDESTSVSIVADKSQPQKKKNCNNACCIVF